MFAPIDVDERSSWLVKEWCPFTLLHSFITLTAKSTDKSRSFDFAILAPHFLILLYYEINENSSEIFGIAKCEIIHLSCELWSIAPLSQCEVKFALIRFSEYFTFAEQIFHSEAISLDRRANFVEKSTHRLVQTVCVLFSISGRCTSRNPYRRCGFWKHR